MNKNYSRLIIILMAMKNFLRQYARLTHYLPILYQIILNYGRSFLILFISLWFGDLLSAQLPIALPGSIIGLLILFFLLAFHIVPASWMHSGCNLFTRYMTILFIPAAMGIMDNYIYLIDGWVPIIVSSLGSTVLVMILIGWLINSILMSKHDIKGK